MTRRPHHTGRKAAVYALCATLLAEVATIATTIAARHCTDTTLIAAVGLDYCSVVALVWVAGYSLSAARAAGRADRFRQARADSQPAGRPKPGTRVRPVAPGWGHHRGTVPPGPSPEFLAAARKASSTADQAPTVRFTAAEYREYAGIGGGR
jgi:hypothetical protein